MKRFPQLFRARYLTLIFVLVLGLVAWTHLDPLCAIARMRWRVLSMGHLSYSESRYYYQEMIPSLLAKRILPDDVSVEILPGGLRTTLEGVCTRYSLYPLRLAEHGDFILAYGPAREAVPGEDLSRTLTSSATLYARPGQSFRASPQPITDLGLWATAVAAIGFAVFNIFLGRLVLRGLGMDLRAQGRLWSLSICYLLGFLILTGVVWIYLLFGGPVSVLKISLLWGGIFVLALSWGRRGHPTGSLVRESGGPGPRGSPRGIGKLQLLVGVAAVCVYTVIVANIVLIPVLDWDGMSHWILKAKILAQEHRLVFDYTHLNQYPLLWPLNVAIQFMICGPFDQLAQWTIGWFFLVFACQLHKGMRVVGVPALAADLIALVFVLAWMIVPLPEGFFMNFNKANAENLFLAYFSALLVVVLMALRDGFRRPVVGLAIALAAGVSLTKIEGSVALFFLSVALLILVRRERHARGCLALGLGVLGVIVLPLLWSLWIQRHGYGGPLSHLAEGLSLAKLLLLLKKDLEYSLFHNLVMMNMLFMLLFSLAYRYRTWPNRDRLLGIVSVGLIFFAWFANAGRTITQIEQMNMEVVPRLFLHAAPAILFFWASRTMSEDCRDAQGKNG